MFYQILTPVIPKADGKSIHHADRPIRRAQKQRTPYGQKIETAQRRQRSNIFGLGPVLHNKLAVDA